MIVHLSLPHVFLPEQVSKFLNRWTHLAKAFGIRKICFIDLQGIAPYVKDDEMDSHVVQDLDQALRLFPGHEPVYVEIGGQPIGQFQHPKKAVYIFGSDYGGLSKSSVSISSKLPLYSDHAAAIILNDRIKQWPFQ